MLFSMKLRYLLLSFHQLWPKVEIIDRVRTSPAEAARTYYLLATLGCACFYSYPYRTKLRTEYSLPEEPCGDCLVHWCCIQCALCQEYRELSGLDPSKGWAAHAQKMNQNEIREPPALNKACLVNSGLLTIIISFFTLCPGGLI